MLKWLLGGGNIVPRTESLLWTASDVPGSLQKLLEYVEAEANSAINWYFTNKTSKALWSRAMRFLAIALSSVAGVLPIFLNVVGKAKPPGTPGIESGLLVSLLLGVAAGLLGLDHFFGFSSGWVRYVLTATAMQGALEEFRMDWQLLSAHLSAPPTNDQVLALLDRARTFRASIASMVLDETKAWAAEFQTNVAQLEKNVKAEFEQQRTKLEEGLKAREEGKRPGGIEVKVPNALTLDDRSFSIWVDGVTQPEMVVGGTVWSRTNVVPGQYKVAVKGKRAGADVQASSIVKVESGQVASAEVALPS